MLLELPTQLAGEISELSKTPESAMDSEEDEHGIPDDDELIDQLSSYPRPQE